MDPDIAASVFGEIHVGMFDSLSVKYDIDLAACVRDKRPFFELPEEPLRQDLESFVRVLRLGLMPEEAVRD